MDYRVDASDGGIADATISALEDLNDELAKELGAAVKKGGSAARTYLRGNSPKATGEYAKGWATRSSESDGHYESVVYNASKPSLTHLLTGGYEKVLWGHRTGGRVGPAQPEGFVEAAYERGMSVIERELGG